jgi:arylsulfatase A-like enzyme
MDLYPTILDAAGVRMPHQPVLDGISLLALLDGQMKRRPKPMGFMSGPSAKELPQLDFVKGTGAVWIAGVHKLVVPAKAGQAVQLFDIYADPAEKVNLAGKEPGRAAEMRRALDAWRQSVRDSYDGKDYL